MHEETHASHATPALASLKVVFAGTPEFAAVAVAALHAAGHQVPLVLTQPDRPAGRGMKLQASPVKQWAQAHGVPVAQPRGLRLDGRWAEDAHAAQAALMAAEADVMVVAAYGLILPRWVLTLPRLGCLNIHASLLPRWRGAAPIHRAIEAGDAETGTTIMQMDEGLDTGDMLRVERLPIGPHDTTERLHDALAEQGGRLIVAALADAAAGRLQPVRQHTEGVTYAHKIDKAEGLIDWATPAEVLARRARAFDPFPGLNTVRRGEVLKVWSAQACDGQGVPGTVLAVEADALRVACGVGALRLTVLQRPGGRRQPAAELLKSLDLQAGERLG